MLVSRGAYIRGGLYSGGAYIRDFTVFYKSLRGPWMRSTCWITLHCIKMILKYTINEGYLLSMIFWQLNLKIASIFFYHV